MRGISGGLDLVGFRLGKAFLASIYRVKVAQKRLDRGYARVVPVAVYDLSRERFGNAGGGGNRFPATRASFTQTSLEEEKDGFHVGSV